MNTLSSCWKVLALLVFGTFSTCAQTQFLLLPGQVFDGEQFYANWAVLIENDKISAVGPAEQMRAKAGATVLQLEGCTLLPGLIEGHAHLLLHPYNETTWDDQVAKESDALRIARATVHARKTLLAGFTTIRDLGSEGAGSPRRPRG